MLVTAGGTREAIDSVRYVGNRSSGRMGLALAAEAAARGADVTLVAANVAVPVPAGVRAIEVVTAAELQAATEAEFAQADVLLMAAAVADFRPTQRRRGQAQEERQGRARAVAWSPRPTCSRGCQLPGGPVRPWSGFAAEHGEGGAERAREKLVRKGLDAVVLNDISRPEIGFDSEQNEVTIITGSGESTVAEAPKDVVAGAILDRVEELRTPTRAAGR